MGNFFSESQNLGKIMPKKLKLLFFPKTSKVESQNFLDPVLAKP